LVNGEKVGLYQQSFANGEMDHQLWGACDLPGYYEGLAAAHNVWITATGSVEKRYGCMDVANFPVGAVRLLPFTNTAGPHYLLSVRAGSVAVIDGETAQIIATVASSALTEAALVNLNWAAWGDSVIFVGETVPPLQLKWNGSANFSLAPISFSDIPTHEFTPNDVNPATTLTMSARTGFATATIASDVFQDSDVGNYIQIFPFDRLQIQTCNSPRSVAGFLAE
jgi:hypothetical protein